MVNQSWIKEVAKKELRNGSQRRPAVYEILRYRIAADTAAATATDDSNSLSLHSVEGFLQNLKITHAAGLFACRFDPLFLQRVFGGAIGFVEDAEDARERKRRQFVRGQFVRHIMSQLVLGCVVPFL